MFDLFRAFSNENRKSKSVAKDRLKLVLVNDRVDCSPQLLEMIKADIISVISNYAEIEESGFDIKMSKCRTDYKDNPMSAVVANIPLKGMKDRRI